jgi:hypothetical protein
MKPTIFFLLLCFTASFFSCQSEPDDADRLLQGRWEIQNAYRNGQPTQTLEGLFFEFTEAGIMKTNLPISAENAGYELDDGIIRQIDADEPLQFEILSITDSTLTLGSEIRDFDFRFVMNRRAAER